MKGHAFDLNHKGWDRYSFLHHSLVSRQACQCWSLLWWIGFPTLPLRRDNFNWRMSRVCLNPSFFAAMTNDWWTNSVHEKIWVIRESMDGVLPLGLSWLLFHLHTPFSIRRGNSQSWQKKKKNKWKKNQSKPGQKFRGKEAIILGKPPLRMISDEKGKFFPRIVQLRHSGDDAMYENNSDLRDTDRDGLLWWPTSISQSYFPPHCPSGQLFRILFLIISFPNNLPCPALSYPVLVFFWMSYPILFPSLSCPDALHSVLLYSDPSLCVTLPRTALHFFEFHCTVAWRVN